jgi:hypothetical protein
MTFVFEKKCFFFQLRVSGTPAPSTFARPRPVWRRRPTSSAARTRRTAPAATFGTTRAAAGSAGSRFRRRARGGPPSRRWTSGAYPTKSY